VTFRNVSFLSAVDGIETGVQVPRPLFTDASLAGPWKRF